MRQRQRTFDFFAVVCLYEMIFIASFSLALLLIA